MTNRLKLLLILLFFLGISVYVNLRSENIIDPDSLYHIRHAWIYQTNGIFDSSFPWTQFWAIRIMGADLWYGFHVFLIPFTYIKDLAFSIKIAGISITFLVLVSFYLAFKNINIKFPELWVAFFLFSSPAILTRMMMMRPHPLSLGLTALIFSFFYRGSAMLVFIFSFLLSWMHSSVFWFPIIAVCVLILVKRLNNQEIYVRKFAAFLGGIAAGLLARPHPLANLKLIYIQVVDLYLSKSYELAKIIGAELRPSTWGSVFGQKWLFAAFIAALVYLVWRIYKKESLDAGRKVVVFSSLFLVILSVLMYSTAKRAIDQLGLFITIFAGSTFFLKTRFESVKRRLMKALLLSSLSFISFYNL